MTVARYPLFSLRKDKEARSVPKKDKGGPEKVRGQFGL
jgi:hypothetical protein